MKLFRYSIVGGIAACFDIAFFYVFSNVLGFNYLIVGGLGFILATAINYVISIRVVFTSGAKLSKRRELTAVYLISGIGLLMHEIVLYVAVSEFAIPGLIAKIGAIGSVFFWNYFLRRWLVFG